MKDNAFGGEFGKASKEQLKLLEINGPMYVEGNPVGIKFLLSELKVCSPFVRLPLVAASESLQEKIRTIRLSMKK
jgi:4-hydroxy-tetrahydrodipicolinate synthase